MKVLFAFSIACGLSLLPYVAQPFEIELPKHYREDLEAKRDREGEILWRELDRASIEEAVREFIAAHPQIDGVELGDVGGLHWSRDGGVMAYGPWSVFLTEWEFSFPPLKRITWSEAKLVASLAYDWKSKIAKPDGNGEIRLNFQLARRGAFFRKKVIAAHFEGYDYGEVYLILPFGGVELRRANQPPAQRLHRPVSNLKSPTRRG